MPTYQETLDYLYRSLPMFQRVGDSAFKKDLSNTLAFCTHLGDPQRRFRSVHVAGTNGKGSSSHTLAAVLQSAGYKTGLYTSPHLKSFTERIKIDGKEIPQEAVMDFVWRNKAFLDSLKPSFFETTVAMAFWYFAWQEVDVAIIEVGMGGRYDSTNVIVPDLSLITSIGLDHVQFLGGNLAQIAFEKAGIIKSQVPVVIGQTQEETIAVFREIAIERDSPIVFADQIWEVHKVKPDQTYPGGKPGVEKTAVYEVKKGGDSDLLPLGLLGDYQRHNLPGILEAVDQLRKLGWRIPEYVLKEGLAGVVALTGIKGRWQVLGTEPTIIADTGHNEPGIREILTQLSTYAYHRLWMILGMVRDKDISKILSILPQGASYVFCQADLPRAMPAEQLAEQAAGFGLAGTVIREVNLALDFARKNAGPEDLIFVGGSTFVVAEIDDL